RQEQKQLGIRFAHKAFLLATLDLDPIFYNFSMLI
ncbi:hypothetical protein J541_4659, partial [Acinetobacter pittii]